MLNKPIIPYQKELLHSIKKFISKLHANYPWEFGRILALTTIKLEKGSFK